MNKKKAKIRRGQDLMLDDICDTEMECMISALEEMGEIKKATKKEKADISKFLRKEI